MTTSRIRTRFGPGLLFAPVLLWMLCLPGTAWSQVPGEEGDGETSEVEDSEFLHSKTLRVGLFITTCVLTFPACLMGLYAMVLKNNSDVWPRTLFGICLGLWGAICALTFGFVFAQDLTLGDPDGPAGGYRLQLVGGVVAIAWFLSAYLLYRRPAAAKAA